MFKGQAVLNVEKTTATNFRKDAKMLAIVESCGKQYQLQEGRYVDFEYLGADEKAKVEFDKVVMIIAGENSIVGQPYVEGAKIAGTVLLNAKDKKVLVYKQRCKKGYRKKQGHRQMFSRVMIDSIEFPGKENLPAEEVKSEKPVKKVTKKAAPKSEKKAEAKAETVSEEKTVTAKKSVAAKKSTSTKKTTTKKAAPKAETKTEE